MNLKQFIHTLAPFKSYHDCQKFSGNENENKTMINDTTF